MARSALAHTCALYGWPEATGRIYGLLAFADEPLSQDDLAERLGVSKATVNTNIRSLERLHFVYWVETDGEVGLEIGRLKNRAPQSPISQSPNLYPEGVKR